MRRTGWMAAVAGGLALAACSAAQKNEQAATATGEDTAGVTREEAPPSPPPPSPTPSPTPFAAPVIQTQPGPEGRYVDLLRAQVTGDVLSVALTYRAAPGERSNGRRFHGSFDYKIDQVSAIDDSTSRRLGVLKDDRGQWMAAPLSSDSDQIYIEAGDEDVQAWFKFPAPSPEAKTVSINVPGAGSFDAVPITR